MAHYDIFRHHLAIKYPAYGHALWEPSPGDSYPAVEVGDVGFIRDGRFHRLFNALLPADDPSHENLGVPEYHSQLTLRMREHIITSTLSPNNFCSARVASESSSRILATGPDSPAEVAFSCRGKQGAVLSLPIQARCRNTLALGQFGEWITKHIDCWFAWARHLGLGIDRMEDIILARKTVRYHWELMWPDGEGLLEDQCIFIRGFRVARKFVILPRGLKAAAGPNPDPKGYDYEPDVEFTSALAVPEYRDPLHILLEYIAEEAPHCDMALVHDDDLVLLDGLIDDTSLETLQPDTVLRHLRCLKPEVHDATFGPDPSSFSKSANTDAETFRVATLSMMFGGRSPSPTLFSSRQSLDCMSEVTYIGGDYLPQSHPKSGGITPATKVQIAGQRPSTQEGRSNRRLDDASGIPMWNLLQFLADQQPSTQEGWGDRLLDSARELVRDNETMINASDLEIIRQRIIHMAEIKEGLESKRGLSRYLQAREYRKAAKETLKYVKTVFDRARDATIGHSPAVAVPHPIPRQRSLARSHRVVPLQVTVQNPILSDNDFGASKKDLQTTSLRKRLCDEMKPRLATLVETMYHFKTSQARASISYNAGRAQELLRDLNFIYPEPRTGRDLYRHPIIQRAIDTTWFRHKDDVGIVNYEQFSPMPISIIAITLTVIECCIDEWSDGMQRDCNWDDAKIQTVYDSHFSSLVDFQAQRPTSLYQLQCDLSRNAREHAGVPPDPVGSSKSLPGALDTVREEDDQPGPNTPPDYDDTFPRITVDHA